MPKKEYIGYGVASFTLLGFFVIGYLSLEIHGSGLWFSRRPHHYTVKAEFSNVGGLRVGAPVSLAGVKVGEVAAISLEASRGYHAVVILAIEARNGDVPSDSIAAIQTAGLLGANFIAISPGNRATPLVDHGEIQTGNFVFSLERLVSPLACDDHNGDCARTRRH